jgi:hypothetical protein
MESDWEKVKEQLFTPSIKDKRVLPSTSGMSLSTPLNKSRGALTTGSYPTLQIKAMDNKMIKYSRVVKSLNDNSKQHLQFPLTSNFYNLVASSVEEREVVLIKNFQCHFINLL